jgi:hypothetical protein
MQRSAGVLMVTTGQQITFEGITQDNICLLKDLNIALFPIVYMVRPTR